MSNIIDGKAFAQRLCDELKGQVDEIKASGTHPCIAVVLVGDDPASHVYVRNKVKRCEELDIKSIEHRLDVDIAQDELMKIIEQLNSDPLVHGILVQLPLPKQIEEKAVINAIDPQKDVDGFHVENVGALSVGDDALKPCTPLGSLMMLQDYLGDLSGKHAVVVGRSNIVGKPMSALLLNNHCTVTTVHSRTKNIESICQQADILVAAVGRPRMIKASWVKEDVGINRIEENGKKRLVGDVDFDDVQAKCDAITPVPGGVGPMTIACLMYNTVAAARKQAGLG
jgi:methylenetetrahydrofolate dehydrogenase (NADP+)/methenyltetrahydrofolate cyclohydrolase